MAMVVMNNSAAIMTLNELNKNTKKLSKSLQQAASGMQLNNAGDGAAEYAISERMRVQIRSLGQDVKNTRNGRALLNTAEGGVQSIVNELRNLKAMALDSANDTNTDVDRATIQKEFSSRMEEINDIASTTNYNSRLLLDGTYFSPKPYQVEVKDNSGSTPIIEPTTKPIEPAGLVTLVSSGDYTISTDGIYKLDMNYKGNITIEAQNVELQQTDTYVNNTYINCTNASTNLWLNNIQIIDATNTAHTPVEKSVIKFSGTANTLNLIGTNTVNGLTSYTKATINVGEGLTIEDGGSGKLSVSSGVYGNDNTMAIGNSNGAAIGSDQNEISQAYIVLNGGQVDAYGQYGAGIGSGENGSIGSITVNGGQTNGHTSFCEYTNGESTALGAGIGSGSNGIVKGNITITGGTVIAMNVGGSYGGVIYAMGSGAGLGSGMNGKVNGNIVITGGTTTAKSIWGYGAAIGTGSYTNSAVSSVGNITIKGGTVQAESAYAEAVGSGALYNGLSMNATEWNGQVGTVKVYGGTYSGSFTSGYHVYSRDASDTSGIEDDKKEKQYKTEYYPGNPLIIHTGPKSNQELHIFINDMHTTAMGLNDAGVDPRGKAIKSLGLLDNAIDYALGENTRIGAYSSELEYTEANLLTASENIAHAESVVRDADMAKTMTEYAKNNVLSQAAQSMLAQANQESSSVLSLLK